MPSCREDFVISSVEEESEELSFVSEINPNDPIVANLFKTINLIGDNSNIDISLAEINFGGTDFPTVFTKIIYTSQDDQFILRNKDFRPTPGNTYWIEAWLPGSDLDTIKARTFVPQPIGLSNAEVLSIEEVVVSEEESHYNISLAMAIEEPVSQPAYFQILPSRLKSTFRMDANGQMSITNSPEKERLNIVSIESAQNAVQRIKHKDGVFIDYSRLTDDVVILNLSTSEPLKSEEEIINILDIEVNTLSEELYQYHISLNQQLISTSSDFFSPSVNYTNIENGLGVLGSFSTKSVLVER